MRFTVLDPDSAMILGDLLESEGFSNEARFARTSIVKPIDKLSYRYGYGDGYGDGYGYGYGYRSKFNPYIPSEFYQMNEVAPGQMVMVAAGNGWMFVGRFLRPAGLLGGVFDQVTNIVRTGGTPWDDLCRGIGRDQATLRQYPDGEIVIPNVLFAVPWTT